MIPILFKIGPLEIGSYGVMMAMAFLITALVLARELRLRDMPAEWAYELVLWAALGGIIGARLYFILEHFPEFLADPLGMIFSRGGLTWYGGFFLGSLTVLWKISRLPVSTLELADIIAPLILLGYAIGRIGCLLSGDGDYGVPTDVPWAMAFPNGLVPTDVPVHPTPLYETLLSGLFFLMLWRFRRIATRGWMVSGLLIFYGLERFIVEFWRRTPAVFGWMTMAQIISIGLIVTGTAFGVYTWKLAARRRKEELQQLVHKTTVKVHSAS
ncbi:MAG: prolipoprotein diacylglyceryl transferase [Calditrichaeota bacterium]|nr:prolipoprotein diacylglyceryl transferase [Calditrichota bacterium]